MNKLWLTPPIVIINLILASLAIGFLIGLYYDRVPVEPVVITETVPVPAEPEVIYLPSESVVVEKIIEVEASCEVMQFQSVTELQEWVDNLDYAEVIQAFALLNDGKPSFPMDKCRIAMALQLYATEQGYFVGWTKMGEWHYAGVTVIGHQVWIIDYIPDKFICYPKGFVETRY